MKKECEITQDLLIGYCDKTLNPYSQEFVENHLKDCPNCKSSLLGLQQDISEINDENKEINYFKSINKKINRKKIIVSILSSILIIFIIFNIILFYNSYKAPSQIEVFFDENTSTQEIENLKNELENKFKVKVTFTSKEKSLQNLKNKLGNNSNLLDNYEDSNPLPSSLTIEINSKKSKELLDYLSTKNNIKHITEQNKNPYSLFLEKIINKIH